MALDRGDQRRRDGGGVSLGANENRFPFGGAGDGEDFNHIGDLTTEKLQARSTAHLGNG